MNLEGQLRWVSGVAGGAATGWDMTAALALGRAAGIPARALAEFLPVLEPAAVGGVNSRLGSGSDG